MPLARLFFAAGRAAAVLSCLIGCLLGLPLAASAQRPLRGEGNPLVRSYSLTQIGNYGRVNAIARDAEGFVCFGTSEGVLRFDGYRWQLVPTPSEVTALALGPDSVLYWGGRSRYGRLERNDSLRRRWDSRDHTPLRANPQNFGDVFSIQALDANTIAFVSTKSVSRYSLGKSLGDEPRRLEADYPNLDNNGLNGAFTHAGKLYVNLLLAGDSLGQTNSLFQFISKYIPKSYRGDSVRLFPRFGLPLAGGRTLVGTADGKLLLFDGAGFSPAPVSADVREYFSRAGLTAATRVGQRYLALGTASGGCVVLDAKSLQVLSVANLQNGLPDNEVIALTDDLEGGLWIAHGQGVSRLCLDSPLRDYSGYGALGAINKVVEHEGTVFVATNSGVYALQRTGSAGVDEDALLLSQRADALFRERRSRMDREIVNLKYEYAQNRNNTRSTLGKRRQELERLFRSSPPPAVKKQVDKIRARTGISARQREAELTQYINDQVNYQLDLDREKKVDEIEQRYKQEADADARRELQGELAVQTAKSLKQIHNPEGWAFVKVRNLESKCIDLVSVGRQLIAATASGLFVITPQAARNLWRTEGQVLYQLYPVRAQAGWLLVASSRGVLRFRLEGAEWAEQEPLRGVETAALSVAEVDRGHLLVSTADGRIRRFTQPLAADDPFEDAKAGLSIPDYVRPVVLRELLGQVMAFSTRGGYLASYRRGRFEAVAALSAPGALEAGSLVAEAGPEHVWVSLGTQLARLSVRADAVARRESLPWAGTLSEPIRLLADARRAGRAPAAWVVAGGRLLYVPTLADSAPRAPARPRVAQLSAAIDSTFDPVGLPLFSKLSAPWWNLWRQLTDQLEASDLSAQLSAPLYGDAKGPQFRYRMSGPGRSDAWVELGHQPLVALTGLDPGRYTLEVEARDALGRTYAAQRDELVLIDLPSKFWHHTGFQVGAVLALLALGGFGVWRYTRWRTQALEKKNRELEQRARELNAEREALLHNILPPEIARELEKDKEVQPKQHKSVTVLFTDFKGFTLAAAQMKPKELVEELNQCFTAFDEIMQRYGLEKIKTIGDAYMAAAGIPTTSASHAVDAVLAGLAIQQYMRAYMQGRSGKGKPQWELRLGIHSGPLVAGVIGRKKFAYDIWGDTVNTAARMESSGEVNRVNISAATYALVKDYFECTHRGEVEAKGKGKLDMYFVEGLKAHYAEAASGPSATQVPNALFWRTVGKTPPATAA